MGGLSGDEGAGVGRNFAKRFSGASDGLSVGGGSRYERSVDGGWRGRGDDLGRLSVGFNGRDDVLEGRVAVDHADEEFCGSGGLGKDVSGSFDLHADAVAVLNDGRDGRVQRGRQVGGDGHLQRALPLLAGLHGQTGQTGAIPVRLRHNGPNGPSAVVSAHASSAQPQGALETHLKRLNGLVGAVHDVAIERIGFSRIHGRITRDGDLDVGFRYLRQ